MRNGKRRRKKETPKNRKVVLLKDVTQAMAVNSVAALQRDGKLPRTCGPADALKKIPKNLGYLKHDPNKIAKVLAEMLPHDLANIWAGPGRTRTVIMFETGILHLILSKLGIEKEKRRSYIGQNCGSVNFIDDGLEIWRDRDGNIQAYDNETRRWITVKLDDTEVEVTPTNEHQARILDKAMLVYGGCFSSEDDANIPF